MTTFELPLSNAPHLVPFYPLQLSPHHNQQQFNPPPSQKTSMPEIRMTGSPSTLSQNPFFCVTDRYSSTHLLVNKGADVSIIPPTPMDKKRSPTCNL